MFCRLSFSGLPISPHPEIITDLLSLTIDKFHFLKLYITRNIQHVFSFYLFPFIQHNYFEFHAGCCIACINSSLLFITEKYSSMCTYPNLLLHLLVDGHLGSFSLLAFVNLLWTFIYMSGLDTYFHFFWINRYEVARYRIDCICNNENIAPKRFFSYLYSGMFAETWEVLCSFPHLHSAPDQKLFKWSLSLRNLN